MRIGIVSSMVPLVGGGYRSIAEWLQLTLAEHGHEAGTVWIPSVDALDGLLQQALAFRLMHLEDHFDRVVTLRPPAHMVLHSRKVVWFIHHVRVLYDMWESEYNGYPDTQRNRTLRDGVRRADTAALREAHLVFANSGVMAGRLRRFNGIESEVLYPPLHRPQRFQPGPYGDEIACVCRMEQHKRQHLLIQAMRHTRTPVRLLLCGTGEHAGYLDTLRTMVAQHGLEERVTLDCRWISEEEKAAALGRALASAYIPFDEDSYGYPTIGAAQAKRCTITLSDAGGVLEFVEDGVTGIVAEPGAQALADAFDRLYRDKAASRHMGEAAAERVATLGISWDRVVTRLLS